MAETNTQQFQTPMMQQYMEIKKNHADAILFFRLGDFYEMFLEDAKIGAQILGITLTARNKGKDGKIPMAGVPYHSAESYINKLVHHGHKVAVCEQTTSADTSGNLVEREVIRVVTPSTNLSLEETNTQQNFLMSFTLDKKQLGVSFVDVASGDVFVTEEEISETNFTDFAPVLTDLISRYQPTEVICPPKWYNQVEVLSYFADHGVNPFLYTAAENTQKNAADIVKDQYQVPQLAGYGMSDLPAATQALAETIFYLKENQKSSQLILKNPHLIQKHNYMKIPRQTFRNLEIFQTIRSGEKDTTLFGVIDTTLTPMGSRKIRQWLIQPLLDVTQINQRLDTVASFIENFSTLTTLKNELGAIADIEKNLSRLAAGVANARDLISLKQGLMAILNIREIISALPANSLIEELTNSTNWNEVKNVIDLIDERIKAEPAAQITEGNIIKTGYDSKLDDLREIAQGGHEKLKSLEENERTRTGINSLKIGFNKVFGYYIEISKANTDKVPPEYTRKQTLTNAERYIIPELKDHEEQVLNAQAQAHEREYNLYQETVDNVLTYHKPIRNAAIYLATIDALFSFATNAQNSRYTRPQFSTDNYLQIDEGRHPVIEKLLPGSFVPNSIKLQPTDADNPRQLMILTGANMAGKSTYIRQVALLVLMAQIGSYVPADKMSLSPIDQVHTRIGAMDDLASGLSTFMVEMTETAHILNNLSDDGLIILDEVGRGTSTHDGLAIAWAVSEYILQQAKTKTLFATHYLELTKLANNHPQILNAHLAVIEKNHNVSFMYRVREGKSSESYGIQVAKHAGLPKEVIENAIEKLTTLKSNHKKTTKKPAKKQTQLF